MDRKSKLITFSIAGGLILVAVLAVLSLTLKVIDVPSYSDEKITLFQYLTQQADSTDNSTENDDSDDTAEVDELVEPVVPGSYRFEETISDENESETVVVTLELNEDGTFTGRISDVTTWNFPSIGENGKRNREFEFSGKLEMNNKSEIITVEYITTTDNNKVEPLHREFEYKSEVTVEFKNGQVLVSDKIYNDYGKNYVTDEYVLERV